MPCPQQQSRKSHGLTIWQCRMPRFFVGADLPDQPPCFPGSFLQRSICRKRAANGPGRGLSGSSRNISAMARAIMTAARSGGRSSIRRRGLRGALAVICVPPAASFSARRARMCSPEQTYVEEGNRYRGGWFQRSGRDAEVSDATSGARSRFRSSRLRFHNPGMGARAPAGVPASRC
jgi:hypothetical protein